MNYIISIQKCKLKYHFHQLDWKDLQHEQNSRLSEDVVKTGKFRPCTVIWYDLSGWQFNNLY